MRQSSPLGPRLGRRRAHRRSRRSRRSLRSRRRCARRGRPRNASDVHGCARTIRARTAPPTHGSQRTSSRRKYEVIGACGRPSGRAVQTTANNPRSRYEESPSAVSLVSGPNDAAVALLDRADVLAWNVSSRSLMSTSLPFGIDVIAKPTANKSSYPTFAVLSTTANVASRHLLRGEHLTYGSDQPTRTRSVPADKDHVSRAARGHFA